MHAAECHCIWQWADQHTADGTWRIIFNILMAFIISGMMYLLLGHVGEPMDIAYGALYLASPESKFVTGSELVIDGEYTAQ